MVEDKVARVVEELQKVAYQSTFSGDVRIPRFAIRYRQGSRTFYTTALAAEEIVEITHIDSLDRKIDSNPDKRWNRPLDSDHMGAIKKYLIDPNTRNDYIIPPMTLDAEKPLNFIDCGMGDNSRITIGFLLIPIGYRFHVTDGQHRIKAVQEALNENKQLEQHAFAVNIVQESSLEKVHQDFADCAKVKPIAASLITSFETREAIRVFTKELCERVPLFERRVERINPTVGKTSSKLYTINHIKVACEELLIADSTAQDRTKSIRCGKELEGQKFNVWLERTVKFFEFFTQFNPQWKQVLALDINGSEATPTLKKLKEQYLLFNGTALAVIGRVGHEILKLTPPLFENKIRELATLDWRRADDNEIPNPLWDGTILVGGKLTSSKGPLQAAVARVKHRLNLPLNKNEEETLSNLPHVQQEPIEVV